jgi:uncharacterized protein
MRIGLVVLAMLPFAGPAAAQSFFCNNAQSQEELAICGNPHLGALDDEMSALYTDIEKNSAENVRSDVLTEQRAFLDERSNCGGDVPCLTALYEGRIAALKKTRDALGSGSGD